MKQALQLKLGQQLALTPQLQQAIKLLQLSTVDLQQTIEETLESNALLERESDASDQEDLDFSEAAPDEDGNDDLAVDTAWEDALPSSAPPIASTPTDTDFSEQDSEEESLRDHLLWQLNLTRFSDTDHLIALALIAVASFGFGAAMALGGMAYGVSERALRQFLMMNTPLGAYVTLGGFIFWWAGLWLATAGSQVSRSAAPAAIPFLYRAQVIICMFSWHAFLGRTQHASLGPDAGYHLYFW